MKVKIKGPEGFETIRGVLTAVDSSGFVVRGDDAEHNLKFSDVVSASTVFVWQKGPKPGNREGR